MACANIIIQGGFTPIVNTFLRPETIRKGSELQDHVFDVQEIRSRSSVSMKAKVVRTVSLNESPYEVEIDVDHESRAIITRRCTWVAGISGE